MLAKAAGLAADEVILDLEDSVAVGRKDAGARDAVAAALAGGLAAGTRAVRVNAVDTPHHHRDVVAVVEAAGAHLDVIVLPKVDDPSHVTFADHLLTALEAELGLPAQGIGLEAQIETARGLAAVGAIAAACPARLEALVVGPGDMAADLGMPHTTIGAPVPGYPGDGWHHVLMSVLVAARATSRAAIARVASSIISPARVAAPVPCRAASACAARTRRARSRSSAGTPYTSSSTGT